MRGAGVARCWAGFASLGAGLVHAAVVPEHWVEWTGFGAFFAVVAAGQLGWGLLALGRDRLPLCRLVAAANVALIVLWAVTRTIGLPVGPDRWTPEAVGAADLGSVALEAIVVVAVAVAAWSGRMVTAPRTSGGRVLAGLAAGALVVGLVTTPALAATSAGEHAHPHGMVGHHGG
jgi:hypothetical protein